MDRPASAADPKPNARTASAASFDDVDASQSTKRARANNQQVVDNASHGASQQLTAMKNAQRSLTAVTQGQANVAMPNSDPSALITEADVLDKLLREKYPDLSPAPETTITRARASHKFQLVDREDTIKSLQAQMAQFRRCVRDKVADRTAYPFALLATLAGCGKTRMCLEALQSIVPKACAAQNGLPKTDFLCLFVALNGCSDTIWIAESEEQRHPEHTIARRLLGSYFACNTRDISANISVLAAMELIRATESKNRNIDPAQLHIFIAIDSATFILNSHVDPKYQLADHKTLQAATGKKKRSADTRLARRFWSQAMGPLQLLSTDYSTPTWLLIAGTKPSQLTDAISRGIADDLRLTVAPVPIAPLSGSGTAELLDQIYMGLQALERSQLGPWRHNARLMRSVQRVAGLPRSVIALCVPHHFDTLGLTHLPHSRFVGLMESCLFDNNPAADTLIQENELVSIGVLFKARETDRLLLFPRVTLIQLYGGRIRPIDMVDDMRRVLHQLETELPTELQGWEYFCVAILNLRILLLVTKALELDSKTQYVSVDSIFPGAVSGSSTPKLFVDAQAWSKVAFSPVATPTRRAYSGRVTLCEENHRGIDGWSIFYEQTPEGEFVPVTLALQCKLHQVESPVSHEDQNKLLRKARAALPEAEQENAVVALLTTSRMDSEPDAQQLDSRSFVLDRAGMDKFTAGFKATATTSQFHAPKHTSLEHARAMAHMIDQHRAAEVFKSVSDLRKFLEQHADEEVTWTMEVEKQRDKWVEVKTTVQYPASAIPSDEVLNWPYALEPRSEQGGDQIVRSCADTELDAE
ncbi:hypothetical protein CAOG_09223 [Capsaspora owczarzaki ATCC 30864]|uniref:Uncharacterized protein n=1 Tax=Capsaspora owczarzaki (strain ATCC 30864) TaxID=595528 RepID=A0A0D2UTM2_CAPO3|nr:hypothetical protein CAOG_09223 [Capsaspora owczarzaki ATCC 30864]KJE98336.1 hypothetical protein CAOG_009223 [Capsaspora owczarzaki ATCC 30864]|eukprot:XP_011270935.1 hypothetical protein CAOG_09223 [Capsaspora owczarzaki ATCC 30864]